MSRGITTRPKKYGMNNLEVMYNDSTRLDAAEAEAVFSKWYSKGENYNDRVEPSNNDAGKFNVRHRNFIIILLELLINSHIKYGNKLSIFEYFFSL